MPRTTKATRIAATVAASQSAADAVVAEAACFINHWKSGERAKADLIVASRLLGVAHRLLASV